MTRSTIEAYEAIVLRALTGGPKNTPELRTETGIRGSSLSNTTRELLRKGLISREPLTLGRWRYYIGNTAPNWQGYEKLKEAPPKEAMRYSVPVRKVIVRPFSIAGENGTSAEVTLPAAPWECVA